jgi:hypothetical protein
MKQSTDKTVVVWLPRCRVSTCEKLRVKCPVCKHMGHIMPHINTTKIGSVIMKVVHGHFTENEDGGRNIACDIGKDEAKQLEIIPSWRLSKQGLERLVSKWNGKRK